MPHSHYWCHLVRSCTLVPINDHRRCFYTIIINGYNVFLPIQPHRPVNHLAGPSQGHAPDESDELSQPRPCSAAKPPEPGLRCVSTRFTQTDYRHAANMCTSARAPHAHVNSGMKYRVVGVCLQHMLSLMFIWKTRGDLGVVKHDQSCPTSAHCSLLRLSYHAQALCSLHPVFLKLFRGHLIIFCASAL